METLDTGVREQRRHIATGSGGEKISKKSRGRGGWSLHVLYLYLDAVITLDALNPLQY